MIGKDEIANASSADAIRTHREQEDFWKLFWGKADSNHVDQKSLTRKLDKLGGPILRNLDLNRKSVLDIGCGAAFIDRYLLSHAECSITAMDFQHSQMGVDAGRKDFNLRFVCGDCLSLPFSDGAFDVVMAVEMLHHLHRKNVKPTLGEMCRVLKPGGHLVLIEINRFHPIMLALATFDKSERNVFFLSIRQIVDMLSSRFSRIGLHPASYFLPTYKYKPPPLVEYLRGIVHFVEDLTEVPYLCSEYVIIAHDYQLS